MSCDSQSIGAQCERRFFEALEGQEQKPYWFNSIEYASPRLDVLGVDAIALVRYPGGDLVRVPVQIKRNRRHVEEYYLAHPEALRARVIILFVERDGDLADIRKFFYEKVEARRSANVRFDDYLQSLEKRPLSGIMEKVAASIAARRTIFQKTGREMATPTE